MSYTDWKYDKELMRKRISLVLPALKRVQKIAPFDYVVVHGTSGVALLGTLTAAGFKTVLVRKDNEGSHGYPIEGLSSNHHHAGGFSYLFLDDFVASGATLGRVRRKIAERWLNCELVGVLEHDHTMALGEGRRDSFNDEYLTKFFGVRVHQKVRNNVASYWYSSAVGKAYHHTVWFFRYDFKHWLKDLRTPKWELPKNFADHEQEWPGVYS